MNVVVMQSLILYQHVSTYVEFTKQKKEQISSYFVSEVQLWSDSCSDERVTTRAKPQDAQLKWQKIYEPENTGFWFHLLILFF